ncbi:MAG: RNA polymerase factor sigma-54 [SAR324 cluster bacterium]|jgi:RNA polymerase sigma-54 factor|uniref:RNA polymerase sigma-54 factor n=1 Tax=marine metagenome TaxID=408172 RepID=A0A381NCZ4_9ZZZZ|nr:RNA polymerase factor sigma-54 [SAR324 cluster bacterium]MDP7170809.1 RNA polymerase factor sigma-54 [SAR324 cluster bacterium]MDP7582204.1 RNA polymerase factor sigma-54 [SAR324 cluster bacterium]HBR60550.1 RNA polymerase sigma-54 factor [Deltaproteobacteria bacterium]HCV46043.1 RNA polymerase sigma-54 factor [Deltaproteobacteria bacterium]|tara:strand:+ start:124 stop:1818 length:1695 start_codon:yes stop_codon:yes gene_type:complete
MAMQMKMQMKMSQQLIMTPQLQQAIKLLQLSRTELEELIEQTLIENPVLEEGIDMDTFPNKTDDSAETAETAESPEVVADTEDFETARENEQENNDQDEIDWQQYIEQVEQFGGYQERRYNIASDDEDSPSIEATAAQTESLADHLVWQLDMQELSPLEYRTGAFLIGNIDDDGFLVTSVRELLESQRDLYDQINQSYKKGELAELPEIDADLLDLRFQTGKTTQKKKNKKEDIADFEQYEEIPEEEPKRPEVSAAACSFVEYVLGIIQQFNPNGVGARSLQECLLIQLDILGESENLCSRIVKHDMPLLESKDLKKIARRQKQDLEQVIESYRLIMSLEPKPGREFIPNPSHHYIIPDVYIYQKDNEYKVALNSAGMPRLRINNYYKDLSNTMEDDGSLTKDYILEKVKAGQWLLKSIEQRQKTIYRVTKSILRFQKKFFQHGINFLRPLVLKDVAEDIDVHESTVSRITTNKYVHTPQGIFELKYFFTSGIDQGRGDAVSSKRIKDMIMQMVQKEDLKSPYTDLQIADILERQSGIKVARRTVAKYREALNILPSNKRKQLF